MSAGYLEVVSWRQLGADAYRSVKLYDSMLWAKTISNLDDYTVCAAPYGGPIAVTNKAAHFSVFRSSGVGAADTLSIFSASGAILGHTALNKHGGPMVAMGWTATEKLAIVFDDGAVDIYDVRCELSAKSFDLLAGAATSAAAASGISSLSRERIELVSVCPSGMAAVTRSQDGRRYTLYLVYDWEAPTPVIGNAGETLRSSIRPTCICAVDGALTADGQMEVLLGTPDRSIVVVDSGTGAGGDGMMDGGMGGAGGAGGYDLDTGIPQAAGTGIDQLLGDALATVAVMMTPSPSGKYYSVMCEDGSVAVFDSAFERKLTEVTSHIVTQPAQMVWCGDDSVVLTWPDKGTVLLVGPYGDTLSYEYGEGTGIHVVPEIDSVRIITAASHECVQKVPDSLKHIRSIGTTLPSAALALAATKFASDDADCDDIIRALVGDGSLRAAVAECIEAALHEWNPAHQRSLLQAASYGKSFEGSDGVDAQSFVAACKKLRVLNACRSHEAGLPLSSLQLDALSPQVVVDRFCMRHNYRMALAICAYLGYSSDKVLVHWACAKVRTARDESDEAIRDSIRRKLASVAGVSYADIAATADSAGRRRLATMLLDYEPRAADQVPILLKMREGRLALEKALDSGDTDLVYLALLHLRRHTIMTLSSGGGGSASGAPVDPDSPEAEEAFMRLVLSYPAAIDLLAAYYQAHNTDPTLLVKLYYSSGRYCDAGHLLLQVGYKQESLEGRVKFFRRAADAFKEGEKATGTGSGGGGASAAAPGGAAARIPSAMERASCAFYRQAVEDEVALLTVQADLEKSVDPSASASAGASGVFVDTSLTDTISQLTLLGDHKKAQQLRDTFKVPDPTFWHVKVRALASARDWKALERFADEKRSPIGYRPFVDACVEHDGVVEAKKYALRIPDADERIEALIACNALVDAAEAALKARDLDALDRIGELAKTPAALEAVEKARMALTGKR